MNIALFYILSTRQAELGNRRSQTGVWERERNERAHPKNITLIMYLLPSAYPIALEVKLNKLISLLILASFITLTTQQSFADSKSSCTWEEVTGEKNKETDMTPKLFSSFSISFKNKKIETLSVESGYSSGEEGGAGFCNLDISKNPSPDQKVNISYGKQRIKITTDTCDGDCKANYELITTNTGYKLLFGKYFPGLCGNNAEWPESIELITGNKTCVVTHEKN
jgi:hypothetical protein